MELKDYWLTIRRRWRLVVAVLLVVVGSASLVTWQTTPQYESSAQLFVATAPSNTGELVQGGTFATQRVSSYADLVGTRKLAQEVSSTLGGEIEADTLMRQTRAGVVPETVSLNITATNPDAFVARDIAQAYAEALSEKVATLETPRGQSDPLVTATIVDDAVASSTPVSPKPIRNIGLGVVLGLIVGVGLAVARDLLDASISSADDVSQVASAPILGHINVDPQAVKLAPAEALAMATPWAESFRVLRTNMQYVEVDNDARVFVISSSLPGEGKSTTAVNLAVTMAQQEQGHKRPKRGNRCPQQIGWKGGIADFERAGPWGDCVGLGPQLLRHVGVIGQDLGSGDRVRPTGDDRRRKVAGRRAGALEDHVGDLLAVDRH